MDLRSEVKLGFLGGAIVAVFDFFVLKHTPGCSITNGIATFASMTAYSATVFLLTPVCTVKKENHDNEDEAQLPTDSKIKYIDERTKESN